MSYLGWRPFKALSQKRAKGKINRVYISVPGFPADGLTSKVLFDRIREVAGLIGIIADE